jgi:putative phosphoesterase
MKIGIVSDTHNRHVLVATALDLLRQRNVNVVLHCGDIEDDRTVRLFQGLETHFVFGNCDTDRSELARAMAETGATLHEAWGTLELEGRRLAWTHGDDKSLLRDLERSEHFDYLFYGHTHHAEQHRSGPTLIVNPGALHRARPKTFGVLDLASGKWETVVVPEPGVPSPG